MAKILSLNVHGLNSNRKRHLALREFRQSGADIILIQETHFNKEGSFAFASRYFPHIYLSSSTQKKAGVVILIKKGTPFTCINHYSDPKGHFFILKGQWHTQPITLCSIYAPNTKQYNFLFKVYTRIFKSNPGVLVVVGILISFNQQLRIVRWWAPGVSTRCPSGL